MSNTFQITAFAGTLMRAEAGDRIKIVLRNNLPFVINLSPSGKFICVEYLLTMQEQGAWQELVAKRATLFVH